MSAWSLPLRLFGNVGTKRGSPEASQKVARPPVVFIHGLGRTRRSFGRLRAALEAAGFPTWARTYPSGRLTIPEAAEWLELRIREDLGDTPVLGVTHSLGGIVVRYLGKRLDWRGLVMLAPPNNGSRFAAALRDRRLFRFTCGPAGLELSDPSAWPDPPGPFAVIAGAAQQLTDRAQGWLGTRLGLFGDGTLHDGTLAVDETRHADMTDFAVVRAGHTFIMDHPEVPRLVLSFFESGRFTGP